MNQRISIVGAGFSGTVLAANLLRRPPHGISEIVLVERDAAMGRGLAYAAHAFPYLLNVPAGRISADSSQPLQFLEFARRTVPLATAEDFLPRSLYGDYLESFLKEAEFAAPAGLRLTRVHGEATTLQREPDGALVLGVDGRAPIVSRQVILALGNAPPGTLPWAEPILRHPAYHGDPFVLPTHLKADSVVLLVGTGLTMVDVAYFLTHDGGRAPRLVALSRRGLMPRPQSEFHVAAVRGGGEFVERAATVRDLVSATRTLVRQVEQHGGDWREAVTFIRNHASVMWQHLPDPERRRFVRHLQGYWDVHRHRLPARLAAHIDALRLTGRLEVLAGRITTAVPEGPRLRVTWQNRGAGGPQNLVVDALINATGPDYVLKRSRNPLLSSLRDAGAIRADALELGLDTTPHLACVARDGTVDGGIYYLGPMLRATHWEATAAAELRNHAEQLATHLGRLAS